MISDSFPTKINKIYELKLSIHKKFDKYKDIELDKKSLFITNKIKKNEIDYLRKFHEELFPINYDDLFFNKILNKLYKILILKGNIVYNNNQKNKKIILGFLVYRYENCEFKYLNLKEKLSYFFKKLIASHILTFGILKEFRKNKLGSILFKEYKKLMINSNIIYSILELVIYNKSAKKFYKKNGFIIELYNPNMYKIDNENYDGIVMKLYIKNLKMV